MMDEGSGGRTSCNVSAENSWLQIKKLKEKLKSLVSETSTATATPSEMRLDDDVRRSRDPPREIRSDDCLVRTFKSRQGNNASDVYSEVDQIDFDCGDIDGVDDSDDYIDVTDADFGNDTVWLLDLHCDGDASQDIFKRLYADTDECQADVSDVCRELQLILQTANTSDSSKSVRSPLIDSRTFTRPKKYSNRPLLTSMVTPDPDGRHGKLQRRLTTTIATPSSHIIGKLEELSRTNNNPSRTWEDGSEEGLADIVDESTRKANRKSVSSSILDRLQELKKSNSSYVIAGARTPRLANGGAEDAEDARKGKATGFDLSGRTPLSSSDIFKSIPGYCSDDNESFFSLEDVSGFCDRLTLSTDPNTYSSIVREMEQNEICFYTGGSGGSGGDHHVEEPSSRRLTFGGCEIPLSEARVDRNAADDQSEPLVQLNRTYEIVPEEDVSTKANTTFGLRKTGSRLSTTDSDSRSSLVDVILQSDFIKTLTTPGSRESRTSMDGTNKKSMSVNNINSTRNGNNNNRKEDDDFNDTYTLNGGNNNNNNSNRREDDGFNDTFTLNGSNNNNSNRREDGGFSDTFTLNEANKKRREKYSTKVFDATFNKRSSSAGVGDRQNGRKDGSDHSEDDCMSTTSDTSYRSVDSNSELKNIEELKSIALQQSKKLSDVKFSTPKSQDANISQRASQGRKSEEWRDLSPIRRDIIGDGEGSQGSSNASSRRASPRDGHISSLSDGPPRGYQFAMRQPPKVAQRELKLKPALIRPSQNLKRMVNHGRSSESLVQSRVMSECKASTSTAGIPIIKQAITPLSTTQLTAPAPTAGTGNGKPAARAPSGIPRPPSGIPRPPSRTKPAAKQVSLPRRSK